MKQQMKHGVDFGSVQRYLELDLHDFIRALVEMGPIFWTEYVKVVEIGTPEADMRTFTSVIDMAGFIKLVSHVKGRV